MKPSDWVRQNNGLDYERAYRLYRRGRFPRPEQPPTGTILVHELPNETNDAVLYARVSSSDQREGRPRKAAGEYERFHSGNRPACDWGIHEVGSSGLNSHSNAFLKLSSMGSGLRRETG